MSFDFTLLYYVWKDGGRGGRASSMDFSEWARLKRGQKEYINHQKENTACHADLYRFK